ncbi:CARL2 protein, partial [Indicator maculatus]|nr:CARL2 protein [Indicator maculatus]
RDVALSVAALSFNLWFTKLSCKDFRLTQEVSEQLLYMLSKSVALEELALESSGLKADFAQRMAQVLSNHPDSVLHTINLAGNQLEDRGLIAFSRHLEKSPKGLQSLSLARTMPTAKGMSTLCKALAENRATRSSLQHLDLSGNPGSLAGEDITNLQSLLHQCHLLSHLSLAGTDCALDAVSTHTGGPSPQPPSQSHAMLLGVLGGLFDALLQGCHTSLVHLDLSRNVYSHRRVKAISPGIKEFFSQACALRHVSLAGTKLPADAVRALLQGLADNSHISDLCLDLSSCELRSAGAQVIQDLIPDTSSISSLDLSDNGLDPDMVTLVLSIGRSKSIRHVSLGRNFNIKPKEGLLDVLHRIVQLTQEDDCPLQSLSVADSRLRLGTAVLLSTLGSSGLSTLDISGNAMGDTGAKMLAKALQTNTKLRTVVWDRNNTTAHGLLEVAQALERNYSLRSMPLPISDVAQAFRSHPQRTEEAVHKLQACLARNQLQRAVPTQTFLLQQGILTSSSSQKVNEICLSLQKQLDTLGTCPGREVEVDILSAQDAIGNANLAVSVLPLLYEAGSSPYQSSKLQHRLQSLAEEASQICAREIQAVSQAVLEAAQGLCPALVHRSGVREQLLNAMAQHSHLQQHLSALLDQMVTDVLSKLNEIKLSVTAAVADCIVDVVLGDLTTAQCKLGESLAKQGFDLPLLPPEPAEDDATAQPRGRSPPYLAVEEVGAGRAVRCPRRSRLYPPYRLMPGLTPRPPRAHAPPAPLHEPPLRQLVLGDGSVTLPSLLPAPLAPVGSPWGGPKPVQPVACENSEDRSITRVDEGLEDFFAKRLITEQPPPTAPEPCAGSVPLAPSSSRTLKKKIGNFFAFKKPKSNRGSRSEKEPEAGPAGPRSRRSMLSDILRAPSRAGEGSKPLSKSEEGGLAAEPPAEPEHCHTPDSARRIRPKYSREGKSQSLILLPGEDEDALGSRQDKKRQLERSAGELPSSFEQRMQVVLHRIAVTKGPAPDSKRQQSKDNEIKKAGSDGDIVDSSADSPPSLKARTHSVSTGGAGTAMEPGPGPAEPRPAWRALGRSLPAEPQGSSSIQQRHSCTLAEHSLLPEPGARQGWSSSLPRLGRSVPLLPAAVAENHLMPRLEALWGTSRRAVSVHEEQLREP